MARRTSRPVRGHPPGIAGHDPYWIGKLQFANLAGVGAVRMATVKPHPALLTKEASRLAGNCSLPSNALKPVLGWSAWATRLQRSESRVRGGNLYSD